MQIKSRAGLNRAWLVVGALATAFLPPGLSQRVITTIAGTGYRFPAETIRALDAPLGQVAGVASDRRGGFYLSDARNHMVMHVDRNGLLRVAAGNGLRGFSGETGPATSASLDFSFFADDGGIVKFGSGGTRQDSPVHLEVDRAGNLYIPDARNHRVRKVTPDGMITTVAGNGIARFAGDGGPATQASLQFPRDVAVDDLGNVYIADGNNVRIRKVDRFGTITTVAGGGEGVAGDGGPATQAGLGFPVGVALGPDGSLYICDERGTGDVKGTIRKVSANGVIDTVAGGGTLRPAAGEGIPATDADLGVPNGIDVDGAGNIYISGIFLGGNHIFRVGADGLIRRAAGAGGDQFGGDGGPATEATFFINVSVSADADGGFYVADLLSRRVRYVDIGGIINTVAGNGDFHFGGDGAAAAGAFLNLPVALALAPNGSLYVSDNGNNRVRRIDQAGIITTVAGAMGALRTEPRDGTPATTAPLSGSLAADGLGSLFINQGSRSLSVRGTQGLWRVAPNGVLSLVRAHDQGLGFDQGPIAVEPSGSLIVTNDVLRSRGRVTRHISRLNPDGSLTVIANVDFGTEVSAVAVDASGNIYYSSNSLVYRINPTGTNVEVVAGNSKNEFSGDGGPATSAGIQRPVSLGVDALQNLYIGSSTSSRENLPGRIRRVGPDGVIETLAGTGESGFSGDGGPATEAAMTGPGGLAVDQQGNVFFSDSGNNRVRAILAAPPAFQAFAGPDGLPRSELAFNAQSDGALPMPQTVTVRGGIPEMRFTAGADQPWILLDPSGGANTPRLLEVVADPTGLAPNVYQGTVLVSMPDARPAERTIRVRFEVSPGEAPTLAVHEAESFSFTYPSGSATRSEMFVVANAGSGRLDFTVRPETDSGGNWLSISPTAARATPREPATIAVTADPQGLGAGTYTGRLIIEADARGAPAAIPVTMTISDMDQAILLTQSGLSFTAVRAGGIVPPQTFGVVNLGRGSMDWSVTTCTLIDTPCDWLGVTPASNMSNPGDEVPQVTVTVDQADLEPGDYYGLVEVGAAGTANSPQVVTAFLEVLPEGSDPGAALTNNELVFTTVAGGGSPSSQDIFAYNVAAEPKSYRSNRAIDAGRLEILPSDGTLDPRQPTRIVVQPFTEEVFAGDYEGNVTLQFSDGRVQEVDLKMVVTEAVAANELKSARQAQEACVPTKLLPALRTLPSGFAVSGGWPVGLQVAVKDDCGRPLKEGRVVVEFSNGDPELAMISLNNGRWDGTWQTNPSELSDVTLRVEASQPSLGLQGSGEVRGKLRSLEEAPVLPKNGVVGSAGFLSHRPLAPGSLISLFGLNLSEGQGAADRLPLPEELQSTRILFAGELMPLLFTSDGQINAMVPYGLNVNTQHQILVQRGPTLAEPVSVDLAATQPAIFKTSFEGTQGHIYKCVQEGTNNCVQVLTDESNPASAGDVLVMYCSGLGEVDPPVTAGVAAGPSRTVDELTVEIGGQSARVAFSGLAPGFSGLYQVNAVVPEGVDPSPDSQVLLRISGQTSALVTMAVQ